MQVYRRDQPANHQLLRTIGRENIMSKEHDVSAVQQLDVAERLALYFMKLARGFQNPRVSRKMDFVSKEQQRPKDGAAKLKAPIEVKTTLDFQVNV